MIRAELVVERTRWRDAPMKTRRSVHYSNKGNRTTDRARGSSRGGVVALPLQRWGR